MGLVNRVVAEAELEAYVKNYAEMIAANAPLTVKAVKYIVGEVVKDETKRNLARCAEMVEQCFTSNDYIEGRRAFMEKRKPRVHRDLGGDAVVRAPSCVPVTVSGIWVPACAGTTRCGAIALVLGPEDGESPIGGKLSRMPSRDLVFQ